MSNKLAAYYSRMSMLISDAHQGQKYGDKPYTYHLRMVEKKVDELFPSKDDASYLILATVALGHDLLEDTYVTRELLLAEGYHEDVISAIDLVTKQDGVSYKEYLRTLSREEFSWKVKVADTYCNLTESIKGGDVNRVRKYSEQVKLLYKYKDWE